MGTKPGTALDTMTDKTPGRVPGETGANKALLASDLFYYDKAGDNGAQAAGTRRMQPGGMHQDANDNLPKHKN